MGAAVAVGLRLRSLSGNSRRRNRRHVLHVGAQLSILPELLSARGALPAVHPADRVPAEVELLARVVEKELNGA